MSQTPPTSAPRPLWLAGPTATGKSALALLLARELDAEIISVDSMQVYRGLDIGTAKPSDADRAAVPHHLIDVADLTQSFDAAAFLRLATHAQQEIQARGRVPLLCGGTGLYFRALLEGLGTAPPADPTLRSELDQRTLPELLDELHRLDPAYYAQVDRANPRRVRRALEVIRLTGRPFSTQRAAWTRGAPASPHPDDPQKPVRFGVTRDRAALGRQIEWRVDEMFGRGLVDEVVRLIPRGLASHRTAGQALGYRQILAHLQGGPSLDQTRDLIKIKTRQYAKRQMTWFRQQLDLDWVQLQDADSLDTVAAGLAARYHAHVRRSGFTQT